MAQSAFLVLHYQNSVVHPDGIWGQNLRAGIDTMGAVEKSQRVLADARMAGMTRTQLEECLDVRCFESAMPHRESGEWRREKILNAAS